MSTVERIGKNTVFIFLGGTVRALLGILLVVYLARYLGDVEYGKYAFAFAFTSLFLILSDLGLSILSIREIARDHQRASEYLTTISLTKLVLSLIMVGIIALVINLMDYPKDTTTAVYIVSFIIVSNSLSTFFRSIFRAFERMEYEAITTIAESVLVTGAAIVVLFLGYGLVEVVSVTLLAQILACLLTLIVCIKKFAKPRLTFDFSLCKKLVKAALPFGAAYIFNTIYFQTDSVMLSLMKGDAVVGWYNAAYRLVRGTYFIPTAFVSSIYPVMSRFFVSSRDNLVITYEKTLKFLVTLAIPLGIGTTLIAGRIISFLYGEEFANSATALQILIWTGSLMFLLAIVSYVIHSIDKQMVDTKAAGISALVNVVLNLLLIPPFSYVGAGIASIISQVVVFTCEFNYLQRHLHKINLLKMIVKPLTAAVIMGIMVYILNNVLSASLVNLFIIAFVAIAIYGLLLYVFKAFNQQEWQLIRSVFSRRS